MKRKPAGKLRLVNTETSNNDPPVRRDPRALIRLDWIACSILCAILVIAPLVAGDFSTSAGVLPLGSIGTMFTTVGVPMLLILSALAYLPFAWREWTKPVAIGDVIGLTPAFALLVAWAALSAVRTPAMYLTINALAVLCAVVMVAGLISRFARDRRAMVAILLSITVAGTVVAVMGVTEYISFVKLHAPQHRSFSTFANPDFLAGYLLITIPIALSLFCCSTDSRLRLLSGISIVVQSSALWLSGSRSGSAIVLLEVGVFIGLALFIRISTESSRWLKIGLVLFVVGSLPALTPLVSRLAHSAPVKAGRTEPGAGVTSSDAQVNSNEFRRWTWIGTANMARANPVLGTGLGAFDLSYGRYAETAFTAHAHNSYLQLMAETGYPGMLVVLIGLAAAAAFVAHALLLQRKRAAETETSGSAGRQGADEIFHPWIRFPEVLLVGLLAGIAGSMLHSLIDSDWYVAATALTFAAIIALAVALARDIAPLSTRRPAPLRKEMIAAGAVLALILLWRGGQLASSRMDEALGTLDQDIAASSSNSAESQSANLIQAREAFRAAAAADPLDPEPHLDLAGIAERFKNPEEWLRELNAAISISKSGKAYYRLGQYYMASSQWAPAYEAFEQARALQPKMLQTLHALAGAYLAAGKTADAERTLQTMNGLQLTPYGQVRAMHELVETEFAFSHALLGAIYTDRKDWQNAQVQYELARNVLTEYWTGRHFLVNESRSESKRKELADLFETVLQQLITLDTSLNRPADAENAAKKLEIVRRDRKADEEKSNGTGSTASSDSSASSVPSQSAK